MLNLPPSILAYHEPRTSDLGIRFAFLDRLINLCNLVTPRRHNQHTSQTVFVGQNFSNWALIYTQPEDYILTKDTPPSMGGFARFPPPLFIINIFSEDSSLKIFISYKITPLKNGITSH